MAVASTKTRWETGEVQTQSASKTPSCQVGFLSRQTKLGGRAWEIGHRGGGWVAGGWFPLEKQTWGSQGEVWM